MTRHKIVMALAKKLYRWRWSHYRLTFIWQRLYNLAYRMEWDPPDGEDWV